MQLPELLKMANVHEFKLIESEFIQRRIFNPIRNGNYPIVLFIQSMGVQSTFYQIGYRSQKYIGEEPVLYISKFDEVRYYAKLEEIQFCNDVGEIINNADCMKTMKVFSMLNNVRDLDEVITFMIEWIISEFDYKCKKIAIEDPIDPKRERCLEYKYEIYSDQSISFYIKIMINFRENLLAMSLFENQIWRREKLIDSIENTIPAIYSNIVDGFTNAMKHI